MSKRKKVITNIALMVYIVFAILFGGVLYFVFTFCLIIIGFNSLASIILGSCMSLIIVGTCTYALRKLTGAKLEV